MIKRLIYKEIVANFFLAIETYFFKKKILPSDTRVPKGSQQYEKD
jgi:hypothetical protein